MGWMSKVAQVVAGENPSVGGLLSRAGLVGGLGAGGAWLLSPEEERVSSVSYERDPEIEVTRSRVAKLQNDLDVFDRGTPEEIQTALDKRSFDLGPKGIDGNIGDMTKAAIREYRKQTAAELDKERKRLADLEGLDTKLSAEATQQAAYEATAPSEKHELLREFGPWAATAAGLGLGLMTRGGAVKKAAIESAKKAAAADALLMPGVAVADGAKAALSPKGLTSRAANLNEFWRMGGAEEAVPFIDKPKVGWRARTGAAEPSELFVEQSPHLRANDVGMIGSGIGEAGLSTGAYFAANAELEAAQKIADENPTQANLARVERAKDMLKIAESAMRLGLGFAGARGFAALKTPYKSIRPNVPGAEAERSLLLDAIRSRTP